MFMPEECRFSGPQCPKSKFSTENLHNNRAQNHRRIWGWGYAPPWDSEGIAKFPILPIWFEVLSGSPKEYIRDAPFEEGPPAHSGHALYSLMCGAPHKSFRRKLRLPMVFVYVSIYIFDGTFLQSLAATPLKPAPAYSLMAYEKTFTVHWYGKR